MSSWVIAVSSHLRDSAELELNDTRDRFRLNYSRKSIMNHPRLAVAMRRFLGRLNVFPICQSERSLRVFTSKKRCRGIMDEREGGGSGSNDGKAVRERN